MSSETHERPSMTRRAAEDVRDRKTVVEGRIVDDPEIGSGMDDGVIRDHDGVIRDDLHGREQARGDRNELDEDVIRASEDMRDDGMIGADDDIVDAEVIEHPTPRAEARGARSESRGARAESPAGAETAGRESQGALFSASNAADFRARWDTVQRGFVDDPEKAVHEGDALVSELMNELTRAFTAARTAPEGKATQRQTGMTEEMRLTLRRRRALFEQLLAL